MNIQYLLKDYIFFCIFYILNFFCLPKSVYFYFCDKFKSDEFFYNNLFIFSQKNLLKLLFSSSYEFFWENTYTAVFSKNKQKYILIEMFWKWKEKRAKQNLLYFFLFNKKSTKFLAFVKTIIYYQFPIAPSWDFKQSYRDYLKNFTMLLVPEDINEYFFLTNYIKTWNKNYEYIFNKNNKPFTAKNHNFKLLLSLFLFFKNFLLGLIISSTFLFYTFYFFKFTFLKTTANWVVLGLLFFWFFSTFNFFIKRYRFAKYTSAIQRFWKRAFMCFWLIEGFLFTIFFYYLLNASGEPSFMFDTFGFFVNHLISVKQFILNSFLIVLLINFFVFLLINIKTTSFRKNMLWLFLCTFVFIYLLFTESYQFYYILNFYIEYIWIFSEEDSVWELDYDIPRTRNKNHYVTLIIVAKFWHYIFIFISWFFFLMKSLELKRIRYSFLSMNLQNVILFYIMNWLCMYSWFKWIFRRFMDQSYYWFFTSFRPLTLTIIFNDFFNLLKNFTTMKFLLFKDRIYFSFYYLINNPYNYNQASLFKKKILLSLLW